MAQSINIYMDQGASFVTTFNIVDANNIPVNLSIYTPKSMMRLSYASTTSYSFSANCFVNGAIILTMNAATTANISSGRYVYDVDLTDSSGNVSRVVQGIVTLTPSVTR